MSDIQPAFGGSGPKEAEQPTVVPDELQLEGFDFFATKEDFDRVETVTQATNQDSTNSKSKNTVTVTTITKESRLHRQLKSSGRFVSVVRVR